MLSVIIGIMFNLFPGFAVDASPKSAEQIIHSFLDVKGMDIRPNTEEYTMLMRRIVWEEYPELTGSSSEFVRNQEELYNVFEYAWEHSEYRNLYRERERFSLEEAELSENGLEQQAAIRLSSSHSCSNAIAYAYRWSEAGTNNHHNPDYPDFGVDDCTNFVSQAMRASGFVLSGSGDGCKQENTNVEWYIYPNSPPPLWCLGSFRDWEWSTAWTVPCTFRDYFAFQNSYAVSLGWTTNVSVAKSHLSPGDVIQLQYEDNDEWISYHTMIVTYEDTNDLYVTYHSNASGYDEVDKSLSSIDLGTNKRFVLVRIIYPELVYLPLVMNNYITYATESITGINPFESPFPLPASPVAPEVFRSPLPLQKNNSRLTSVAP